MNTPESAREHLASVLVPRKLLDEASREIGRNHAYLAQYIKGTDKRPPKPKWLEEADRAVLIRLYGKYGLNEELLKPPPKAPKRLKAKQATTQQSSDPLQIDAEADREPVDDPGTVEVLARWGRLGSGKDRDIVLAVLRTLTNDSGAGGALPPIEPDNNTPSRPVATNRRR